MQTHQGNLYRARRNKLIGCAMVAFAMLCASALLVGHVLTFWTGSAENWTGVVVAIVCAIVCGYHVAPLVKAHIEGGIQ